MQKSSNTSNKENISLPLKAQDDNIVCKDGFCSISNHNEKLSINKDDINLFDPV